jgi:hypothetical protein
MTATVPTDLTFVIQIVRTSSGWWADLWLRDHVEYFGPHRWRWVARIGAWWWLRKIRLKHETPAA